MPKEIDPALWARPDLRPLLISHDIAALYRDRMASTTGPEGTYDGDTPQEIAWTYAHMAYAMAIMGDNRATELLTNARFRRPGTRPDG